MTKEFFFVFILGVTVAGCGWSYNRERGTIATGSYGGSLQAGTEAHAGVEIKARAGITYQGLGYIREEVQGGVYSYTLGGKGDPARNILQGVGETQSGLVYERGRLVYKTRRWP